MQNTSHSETLERVDLLIVPPEGRLGWEAAIGQAGQALEWEPLHVVTGQVTFQGIPVPEGVMAVAAEHRLFCGGC